MKLTMLTLITLFFLLTPLTAKGYTNWGIGPQISFNVPDKSPGRFYGNQDPALGVGVNAVVNFDLGKGGRLSYNPVVDLWFRSDKWDYVAGTKYLDTGVPVTYVKLVDWALNFNLFEARYYPPIGKNVRPYVGLGLASISVYAYNEDVNTINNADYYYNDDIDAGIGANIYVGATLEKNKRFTPFFELRGSGSNSAPNTFKMSVGIHFNKK